MGNVLGRVKRGARALAYRSFGGAFLWERWAARRSRDFQAPVVVLQMGKVGSSSVVRSLEAVVDRARIFHCHGLSDEFTEQSRDIAGHSVLALLSPPSRRQPRAATPPPPPRARRV